MNPLVEITSDDFGVDLDIRYATDNNVTGKALYSFPKCYLHKQAANKLQKAVVLAKEQGMKIKIFDAFRPVPAQQKLWDFCPDEDFVSHPQTGRLPHCRGGAVDLTLTDSKGVEIDMGTEFDDFSKRAYHGSDDVSFEIKRNRYIFMGIMISAGWQHNPNEWWHYQLPKVESYDVLRDELYAKELMI